MNNTTEDDGLDGWITLKEYCKRTGETRQQVHLRVYNGKWQRGVHYSSPAGGGAFVNTKEVLKWIKGSQEPTSAKS